MSPSQNSRTPISSTPILRTVLVWSGAMTAILALIGAVVGFLVAGTTGMWSALAGVLVAAVFLAITGASILVAGPDFGCGSSREHAPWALLDFGFKVVLSPRFADIFRGNAGKQGLVAGVISEADLEAAWGAIEADPGVSMTVDLDARTARIGALELPFDIDDYTRWRLLEGLDDIGLTLRNEEKIAQFEARREAWRPRTLPVR